eukprot:10440706-Heterocapsa_arctica.AAC.1
MASRARLLPHDMRYRALLACFAAQFGYGSEYELPDKERMPPLETALERALWGTRRRSRSKVIVWTVLYKGHAMLPKM